MKMAVADDPLHPVCHGFTPGGFIPSPGHGAGGHLPNCWHRHRSGSALLHCGWPGVPAWEPKPVSWWCRRLRVTGSMETVQLIVMEVMKGLASRIEFLSDEGCVQTRFDAQVMKG